MLANNPLTLPNSTAGQISDAALAHMVQVGLDAQIHDQMDTAGGCLMVLTYAQVCRELQQRRAAMARMGLTGPNDHLRILVQGPANG
ncbi:hypothetical protein KX928_23215 [Roseobacter sp. YSTF-M11]|uniref:Uncharacterized protein n=1 Tax=Roseobacter insulae TaxID=2859783 RepID=A0A9X1G120_9RHOB|nr:hypothetical protein [Roseobacter insulae]MBW4710710.1 hypothetical protein [Roseobacter insulae]